MEGIREKSDCADQADNAALLPLPLPKGCVSCSDRKRFNDGGNHRHEYRIILLLYLRASNASSLDIYFPRFLIGIRKIAEVISKISAQSLVWIDRHHP
jgi:hypothetical protein